MIMLCELIIWIAQLCLKGKGKKIPWNAGLTSPFCHEIYFQNAMILEEFQRRRYWENAVFLYIIKAENIEQGVKKTWQIQITYSTT